MVKGFLTCVGYVTKVEQNFEAPPMASDSSGVCVRQIKAGVWEVM